MFMHVCVPVLNRNRFGDVYVQDVYVYVYVDIDKNDDDDDDVMIIIMLTIMKLLMMTLMMTWECICFSTFLQNVFGH